jgi:hypothetical protein
LKVGSLGACGGFAGPAQRAVSQRGPGRVRAPQSDSGLQLSRKAGLLLPGRNGDDAALSRQGSGDALGVTVESLTKVLGALSGAAGVAYALGALVLARRLQVADLPWREGVATLPKDQVLAAGTVEAGYSLLGALLILLTALMLVWLSSTRPLAWLSSKRPLLWLGSTGTLGFLLCLVAVVSVLLVPFNVFGMLCLALVLILTYWLYRLHQPWASPRAGQQVLGPCPVGRGAAAVLSARSRGASHCGDLGGPRGGAGSIHSSTASIPAKRHWLFRAAPPSEMLSTLVRVATRSYSDERDRPRA